MKMWRVISAAGVTLALWLGAGAVQAQTASGPLFDQLMQVIRLSDTAQIMRDEGMTYGTELARDMIDDGDMDLWRDRVGQIYAPERIETFLRQHLEEEIKPEMLRPLLAFYSSELGREIIGLELEARAAFVDLAAEEAAREEFDALQGQGDPIIGQIDQMVEDSDLISYNLAGIMNANMMLYRGLADGGALNLSEDDILTDIWMQQDSVRDDSLGWVQAFFLTAYRPLEIRELEQYAAFWRSDAGSEFNRALFAVLNGYYQDMSYLIGRAMARQMQAQKL